MARHDWEKIEREYRLGKMTFAEMSATFGVNASTITRRAKKEGWTRDLSELVKQETRAQVSAQVVAQARETHKARITADVQAVEAEAISNALMIADHERAGTKSRLLFGKILDKLDVEIDELPSIGDLIALARTDDNASLIDSGLRKVVALPSIVMSAKNATDGLAKAIEIERKARNLDEGEPPPAPVGRIELVALKPLKAE